MTNKIRVSLKKFILTGRFGPVVRPVTRRRVRQLLGPPDDLGVLPGEESWYAVFPTKGEEPVMVPPKRKPRANHAAIWVYGSFEFHFDNERLWLIFADHFAKLKSGRRVRIEPWIFEGRLRRRFVERALKELGVDYTICRPDYDPTLTFLRTGSGVELMFIEKHEKFGPKLGLEAIERAFRR